MHSPGHLGGGGALHGVVDGVGHLLDALHGAHYCVVMHFLC